MAFTILWAQGPKWDIHLAPLTSHGSACLSIPSPRSPMPLATHSYFSAKTILPASLSASSQRSKRFLTVSVLPLQSLPTCHSRPFIHSHNKILPSMLPAQPALSTPHSLHCCAVSLSPQLLPTALTSVLQATLLRPKLLQSLLTSILPTDVEVPPPPNTFPFSQLELWWCPNSPPSFSQTICCPVKRTPVLVLPTLHGPVQPASESVPQTGLANTPYLTVTQFSIRASRNCGFLRPMDYSDLFPPRPESGQLTALSTTPMALGTCSSHTSAACLFHPSAITPKRPLLSSLYCPALLSYSKILCYLCCYTVTGASSSRLFSWSKVLHF